MGPGRKPGRHVGMGPISVPGVPAVVAAGAAAGGMYELETECEGKFPADALGAPVVFAAGAAFGGTYVLETEFLGNTPMSEPEACEPLLGAGGLGHLLLKWPI